MESLYRDELARRRDRGYLPTYTRFRGTIAASPALRARRAHLSAAMRDNLAAAVADGTPDWRSRLVAAVFAAVTEVLDGELIRPLDADADHPDEVLDGMSPTIATAFGPYGRHRPDPVSRWPTVRPRRTPLRA